MTRPRTRRRTIILSSALAVLLAAGGGTAWALDRFVVEHVEIADVASYEAEYSSVTASDAGSTRRQLHRDAPTSPTSRAVTVSTVTTGTGDTTVTYYVADVVLSDATVLRSAFANNQFGTNIVEDTSTIAAENDAVLAINGDYYGFRDSGIVIRNGVVYRDSRPARVSRSISTAPWRCTTRQRRRRPSLLAAGVVEHSARSGRPSSRTVPSSRESRMSRSTPTSETTASRAISHAPRWESSTPTIWCSWSLTDVAPATAPASRSPSSQRFSSPRRGHGLQPGWRRLIDDGLQRRGRERPTRQGRRTRDVRHPLRGGLRP